MVVHMHGETANDLFVDAAQKLLKYGKRVSPRGQLTIEVLDAWLTLEDPSQSIVTLPERNISIDYLNAELEWYLSGDRSVAKIGEKASMWKRIANPDGTANSNYGYLALVEKHNGKTQYEWCVDRLREDPDSRQAIINYNQPAHKYEGNKDFVCTIAQHFRIREGMLESVTMMRSNDMIFGLTYDLPWFTLLQRKMADELGVPCGRYQHYDQSLHIYERHFSMLEEIARCR